MFESHDLFPHHNGMHVTPSVPLRRLFDRHSKHTNSIIINYDEVSPPPELWSRIGLDKNAARTNQGKLACRSETVRYEATTAIVVFPSVFLATEVIDRKGAYSRCTEPVRQVQSSPAPRQVEVSLATLALGLRISSNNNNLMFSPRDSMRRHRPSWD